MKSFTQFVENIEAMQIVAKNAENLNKLIKTCKRLLSGGLDIHNNDLNNIIFYIQQLPLDLSVIKHYVNKDLYKTTYLHNAKYALDLARNLLERGQYPNKEKYLQNIEDVDSRLE